jgi:hypothetical protein
MRRFTLPLVILASVAIAALLAWLALSTASFGDRRPRAEKPATRTVTQSLAPFKRLDISGTAEITLVQRHDRRCGHCHAGKGETTLTRRFAATPSTLKRRTAHAGGTSSSAVAARAPRRSSSPSRISSPSPPRHRQLTAAEIKVPDLRIAGAGGTSVKIDNLQSGQLRLSGAGAIKAEIGGRVTDQNVSIAGAGEYRGGKLGSQNATVSVAGAGQVVINAEKTLNATISGAGSVDYIGDPKVTERVSGAGRVRRRDAADVDVRRVAIAE